MKTLTSLLFLVTCISVSAQVIPSQWNGKRIAFLGDSITDASQLGTTNDTYWTIMADLLGIEAFVYGISGHQMNQITGQAEKLESEHSHDVDAIMVFAGTNDFNSSVPIGEWFRYDTLTVSKDGKTAELLHRTHSFDPDTFRGRTNTTMKHLKSSFPDKQIILMTPIHRGFAKFSESNEQPDESYANYAGEFIDAYAESIRQAGNIWAVPVIDLNAECGLYPMDSAYEHYFRDTKTDLLHPNTKGHYRMALAIAYRMLCIPAL